MKLHILADIHNEFGIFNPPETDADVVILAGDVDLGQKGLDWAANAFQDKPILYVLGNHEFYDNSLPKLTLELIKRSTSTHVVVLENSEWIYDGVRFLGCTLWSDFRLFGDPHLASRKARDEMNDYMLIRVSPEFRPLHPADTKNLHFESVGWLRSKFFEDFNGPTVVITHHAPSMKSVPPKHESDLLTAAFASDLDDLILRSKANLWVHGHIHSALDYHLGETRVICNPRGYTPYLIPGFHPQLLVEI